MPDGRPWRSFAFSHFNAALVRHAFRDPRHQAGVRRILADPHELAKAIGADEHEADDAVRLFVERVRERIPSGSSLDGYCVGGTRWRPTDRRPPPFFALLWFTCLIAQGYPEGVTGFHRRLRQVLGRGQSLERLNEAWENVAEWSVRGAEYEGFRPAELVLPEPDAFRTNIGRSWFLAFPNSFDRAKLHDIFDEEDLAGELPSVEEVLIGLQRHQRRFSSDFREYLNDFAARFSTHHTDVRESPFWIAIRREILREEDREPEAPPPFVLLALPRDGGVSPIVGVRDVSAAPDDLEVVPLPGGSTGDTSHALRAPRLPTAEAFFEPVRRLLKGELPIAKAVAKQLKRGVVVFDETSSPLVFGVVSGTDADGASHAMVASRLADDFVSVFGGRTRQAGIAGWSIVSNVRIDTTRELPESLKGFRHLRRTEGIARPRLVGGIRTGRGYLAMKGHLPHVRWSGANAVRFRLGGTEHLAVERDNVDDIVLPDDIVSHATGSASLDLELVVVAPGSTRHLNLVLTTDVYGRGYRSFSGDDFVTEGAAPGGSIRIGRPDALPSGVSTEGGRIGWPTNSGSTFEIEPPTPEHAAASRVRDAIAALATTRSDLRRFELVSLFETQLHASRVPRHLFFDILRAYQEIGLYDIAFKIGWRDARVVAREPRLAIRANGARRVHEATLFGLSTSHLDERIRGVGRRLGIDVWRSHAPWRGLVGPLRLRCESHRTLRHLSEELSFPEPVIVDTRAVTLPPIESLIHSSAPPGHHMPDSTYDFATRTFVSSPDALDGVAVQRRRHDNDHTIYVLCQDGAVEGWSYWQHVPLLIAHRRRGHTTYAKSAQGFERQGPGPAMPLIVGRLSTLVGSGPPGVVPTIRGWGYRYRVDFDLPYAT